MENAHIGTIFSNRKELAEAGIHRQQQAGIAWTLAEGAYSIVLSGGYEDDEDHGNIIIYTGEGGRDANSGAQVTDQELTRGNLALAKSKHENKPINVTRGFNHKSQHSPSAGYQYAGKYIITDYWSEKGKSGYLVYRYRLEAIEAAQPREAVTELPATERRSYLSQRIIRDTKQSIAVKQLYGYKCQICRIVIDLPLGLSYAEGAHIKPLGRPHDGPDHTSNLLCLCPNHHVMFDNYVFSVDPETLSLIGGISGKLTVHPEHAIDTGHFKYHNELFSLKNN